MGGKTRKRIEDVIAGRDNGSRLSKLLSRAGALYGFSMTVRSKLYRSGILETRTLPCKAISIGNITLGGAGKTPMAIYVAGLLQSLGLRPAMVYRGYGGACENSFCVVSDGGQILAGPEEAGDEPCLVAAGLPGIPVVVGKDRCSSGKKAVDLFDPDVIVLDDAFQHIRLRRDVDLLLMDSEKPVGNGRVFPGGPLRESAEQVKRAHAVIATRFQSFEKESPFFKKNKLASELPVFRCRHAMGPVSALVENGRLPSGSMQTRDASEIAGKKCLAFSGIANNADFKRLLLEIGCAPVACLHFPDHHKYSNADILSILRSAKQYGAETLVTTEKDAVKLAKHDFSPFRIYAAGVRISFIGEDNARFSNFIAKSLNIL